MMAAALLGFQLAFATVSPAADRAKALWDAGEFEAAADEWATAYAETGEIGHLYARGQAQLMAGQCSKAVATLETFIATQPKAMWIEAAEASIQECRDKLPPEPEPIPEPEPVVLAPDPAPAPRPTDSATEPAPRARPWHRDPAGAVLIGVGAAALATGTVLALVARSRQASAEEAVDVDSFGRDNDRAVTLSRVSIPVLAVGGALLVGGVIRYAIVRRRHKGDGPSASVRGPLTVRF